MLNGEFYTARLCTTKKEPSSGLTLNSWVTENSHTLSSNVTRCLCFRLLIEGLCSPTPEFLNVFDLSISQIVSYCSGKRNLDKFFLTTKLPFVQSYPIILMG